MSKTRSLCFYNKKGGVGKSTLATLFVNVLAEEKETKVLLIDIDSQKNLALYNNIEINSNSLESFLKGDSEAEDVITKAKQNIDYVYIDDLIGANKIMNSEIRPFKKFKSVMNRFEELGYDLIIFDCPPSESLMTYLVLDYVDDVILPIEPNIASGKAILDTISILQDGLELDLKKIKLIIPNKVEKNLISCRENMKEIVNYLREFGLEDRIGSGVPKREDIKRVTETNVNLGKLDKRLDIQIVKICSEYLSNVLKFSG